MKILVTGGTGFIGQELIRSQLAAGSQITCLSRDAGKVKRIFGNQVHAVEDLALLPGQQYEAVVNLAGEPIADRRWSAARKQLLRDSRLQLTQRLVQWLAQQNPRPRVLVSGSAIGYYGPQAGDDALGEGDAVTPGFTHSLCADWEACARQAEALGMRVCRIRTGLVLGHGGALKKMLPAFRLGAGGPVGHGRQWMSWIHLADEVRAIEYLMQHDTLQGAFNLTAPEAVRNRDFARALGRVLKRPALLPLPPLVVKLLLGEGAELLLEGQRVYPRRLLEAGFEFRYPQLEPALRSIL